MGCRFIAAGEIGDELGHGLAEGSLLRGVSLSQSRQNDARTSRVGIERLHALVQLRQEILVALKPSDPTGSEVRVGLALALLPLAGPKPSLLGIDPTIRNLAKQDRRAIDRAIRQAIH
jgi:hypothetical protein